MAHELTIGIVHGSHRQRTVDRIEWHGTTTTRELRCEERFVRPVSLSRVGIDSAAVSVLAGIPTLRVHIAVGAHMQWEVPTMIMMTMLAQLATAAEPISIPHHQGLFDAYVSLVERPNWLGYQEHCKDAQWPDTLQRPDLGEGWGRTQWVAPDVIAVNRWVFEGFRVYVGPPHQLQRIRGGSVHSPITVVGVGDHLYALEDVEDGRRLIRMDPDRPDIDDAVVLSRGLEHVEHAQLVGDRLYLVVDRDGRRRLAYTNADAWAPVSTDIVTTDGLHLLHTVHGVQALTDGAEGWGRWHLGEDEITPIVVEPCMEVTSIEIGPDRIPVTVVGTGEGPLRVRVPPGYGDVQRAERVYLMERWVRAGGVWAVAHVRGSGARGEAWHRAARGETKLVSAHDLNTVVEGLHARGIGTPATTAVEGWSGGALVAAAAVARRPELYGALVGIAGPYDIVNAWAIAGYDFDAASTVHDEARREGLWNDGEYPSPAWTHGERAAAVALSPVHTTPAGPLPPTLLVTSYRDKVVDPEHTHRLAQAWADAPGGPLFVYEAWSSPHGRQTGDCFFGWSGGIASMQDDVEWFLRRAVW